MLKIKKLLYTMLLAAPVAMSAASDCSSSCSSECDSPTSQNLWQPHAFSNYALQEVLILKQLDLTTDKAWVNRFGVVAEYMQNFGNKCRGLGAMPFWSGSNTMTIGNNSGDADLDAYQFGLGDFNADALVDGIGGTITLNPKVQHTGAELMWYGMQNEDKVGAYVKVKAPLGAMRITSNVCQSDLDLTDQPLYGYFLPALRFNSIAQALQGGTYLQDPFYTSGKLASCPRTVIRFGDITAAVGANFIAKEDALFGVGFKVSCPTGNVPQAEYMLEPIFGRAGHWGVGGEITGHYRHEFESDKCGVQAINLWMQGELMHLFSGRKPSYRSFDLKANGKGSKYLLLQHFYNTVNPEIPGQPGVPQFSSNYVVPAINVTTLPVNSTFAMEGNFALMIDFIRNDWNLSIGGEVWGRSQEHLSIDCCVNDYLNNADFDFNLNNYAVLGRQTMDVYAAESSIYCEPLAKINKSLPAYSLNDGPMPEGIKNATLAENRIPANYSTALDICGAQARSIITGKVIGELGYTWSDHCHVPHVSVFGGAEFAGKSKNWVNLWSVGLQGSMQF